MLNRKLVYQTGNYGLENGIIKIIKLLWHSEKIFSFHDYTLVKIHFIHSKNGLLRAAQAPFFLEIRTAEQVQTYHAQVELLWGTVTSHCSVFTKFLKQACKMTKYQLQLIGYRSWLMNHVKMILDILKKRRF